MICFANRELGAKVVRDLYLRDGVDLARVVIHNPPDADIDLSFLSGNFSVLSWWDYVREVSETKERFDAGISAMFGYLIPDVVVASCKHGIVNLHPSLLPYGRGKHPATWAIWEQTPYGASAHSVTSDLDGGPLLGQIRIPLLDTDTGDSLYAKGIEALWDLYLTRVRPWVLGKPMSWEAQPPGGSFHRQSDLLSLYELAEDPLLPTRDRLRLLRALNMGDGEDMNLPVEG